ncbi:MAG: EAL domain-containing protein [Burkholderiaceae bacterium]
MKYAHFLGITSGSQTVAGQRPAAMFALATLLAVFASSATQFGQSGVYMLWLAPAVMLTGLIVRGPSVLIPGIVGIIAGLFLTGVSLTNASGLLAASLLGPIVSARLLRRDSWQANQSHQQRTTSMIAIILGVLAPISALLLVILPGTNELPVDAPYQFAWQWLVNATSGVIVVRCLLALMPADGSGFCPISGVTQQLKSRTGAQPGPRLPKLPLYSIVIVALSAGAIIACHLGWHNLSRMSAVPILAVAALAAIAGVRREGTLAIFLAIYATHFVRIHTFTTGISITDLYIDLAQFQLLTLFTGVFLNILNAVSEERKIQDTRLRRQALTNPISKLPNTRSLVSGLSGQQSGQRGATGQLYLLEISVVGLYQWVDIAGREAVAKVENEIAHFLRRNVGADADKLYHLDSGAFVLLGQATPAIQHSRQLNTAFDRREFSIRDQIFQCQIAIAIVDLPAGDFDVHSAMTALSFAQQESLRSAEFFCRFDLNESKIQKHRDQLAWAENVRLMLKNNRLRLYAQTIVNCQEQDSTRHFEVLARMVDDQGNVLTPDKFLPAIAQASLHVNFDQQVVSMCLDAVAAYNQQAHPGREIGTCAINIMGPTICDKNFAKFLINKLNETGVQAGCITLEITESESILDIDSAMANLGILSNRGVQVAVDDFGTGLATFDYIRKIRPDVLKIDGSFVTSYETDPLDREIVHSTVRLAKAIGARTVAEFVENEAIANQMQSIGVNYLQGWGIARPRPLAQLLSEDCHTANHAISPGRVTQDLVLVSTG